jgi:hypothetical protein
MNTAVGRKLLLFGLLLHRSGPHAVWHPMNCDPLSQKSDCTCCKNNPQPPESLLNHSPHAERLSENSWNCRPRPCSS